MRPKELRDMTVEELKDKHKEYKKELYNLRFQHAIGQLSNTARITDCLLYTSDAADEEIV